MNYGLKATCRMRDFDNILDFRDEIGEECLHKFQVGDQHSQHAK